jgi:hypothetical protein
MDEENERGAQSSPDRIGREGVRMTKEDIKIDDTVVVEINGRDHEVYVAGLEGLFEKGGGL